LGTRKYRRLPNRLNAILSRFRCQATLTPSISRLNCADASRACTSRGPWLLGQGLMPLSLLREQVLEDLAVPGDPELRRLLR
jgi:hypothetical protein